MEKFDLFASALRTSYLFSRIHKTLRVAPAIEVGIVDREWDLAELPA
jgi:hypothetical protein